MIKNLFLYISIGFIMYFGFSDSLLKSQKIHCLNGIEKACKYLCNICYTTPYIVTVCKDIDILIYLVVYFYILCYNIYIDKKSTYLATRKFILLISHEASNFIGYSNSIRN